MNTQITVSEWLSQYQGIISQRLEAGEITHKTFTDYRRMMAAAAMYWADRPLASLKVSDVTQLVNRKVNEGAPHAARRLRINLSSLFLEAQRHDLLQPGYNPALAARHPQTRVNTERLTLDEWLRIFRCASYRAPAYFQNAMLLALVTAQRPSDLVRLHRDHIRGGCLHITQFKTGEKIALPLRLKLNAISTTLQEAIEVCNASAWLIHRPDGRPVNTWSLSRWFRLCRQESVTYGDGSTRPSPFREQRSLAERLYRVQGIDTRTLLGHRYQHMTDQYNNPRGKEFRELVL